MRRSYANTSLIRAGAQRFGTAALEMRSHAQSVERKANELTGNDWRGKGADAYRTVAEHLRLDMLQAGTAFERAAGTMNMLASQLDQVNQLYRQCEQFEHQIHGLQAQLWGAEDERRERLRDQISDLRYRLNHLEQQAEAIDRSANNAAGHQFEQIASMANKVYFATHEVGPQISAADKVGNFFKDLWEQTKETYEEIAEEGGLLGGILGFFEGLISSVIDTLEGLWHLTPSYWVYKAISDPEGTKEKAAKIFHAVTHPVETAKAAGEFIKGIPEMGKVIWSTVMTSIDRDLINGNAYTRSKWAGYVVGIIAETALTAGVGEVGQVVKGAERAVDVVGDATKMMKAGDGVPHKIPHQPVDLPYGAPRTLEAYAGRSFKDHAEPLVEKYGWTMDEFKAKMMTPTHELSQRDADTLKLIRESVPTPKAGDWGQKVYSGDALDAFLNQPSHDADPNHWTQTISTFFSRMEDVSALKTPGEVYTGLRLDYEGTRFKLEDESMVAIRFKMSKDDMAYTPYGGNNAEGKAKMGGEHSSGWPFTGNGFASSDAHLVPEFHLRSKIRIPDGAQLWEIRADGTEVLHAEYSELDGKFMLKQEGK